ncbi:MAG TPA: family 43 glycosylhydrolase [Clostridia bacterium]|nr:family 43 glycosylhydrolase [Clostridia bacterium]
MGIQFKQAIANDGRVEYIQTPARYRLTAEILLKKNGYAGVQLGVRGQRDGGYGLLVSHGDHSVHFMEIKRGGAVMLDRGLRYFSFDLDAWYPIRAEYDGRVARLWFDHNPLDEDPWPKYEFELELKPGIGLDAGRDVAQFRNVRVEVLEDRPDEESGFTNPVMVGADPDILLHKGVYYLYNRVPNDPNSREDAYLYNGSEQAKLEEAGDINAIFRVSSSVDLVHWSPYRPVFFRDEMLAGAFCMSPNVFEKDGWFYLLFAAGRFRGEENFHVHYAVSRSPEGPFTMRTAQPLHSDCEEIGGMPFVDEDGTCYITYVRFDRGNHIWLQRLDVEGGTITPDDSTLTRVLSPEADYEIDEYGRIVEGGVIIPHKGLYYMIYADGHYLGHYGQSYAVAETVYGPYMRHAFNPILHHHFRADGTGDGIVVYSADRQAMYLGYHRHQSLDAVEPRMTCLDRMKFVPNPKGGPDILTVYGPTTTPQPLPFSHQNKRRSST